MIIGRAVSKAGGTHMLRIKVYRDVPPKWVSFLQKKRRRKKPLDMGSILVKKSLKEGPILQNLQKI